ncbi:MAG: hypothetical protein EZS28_048199, partial [Streblomastix strix]
EKGAEQLNAFLGPWKDVIFWIHPPIPKIGKSLIAWEKFKPKSIIIAPWRPGLIWFIQLLTDNSGLIILGENSLILNPEKDMMNGMDKLPLGQIATNNINQQSNKE